MNHESLSYYETIAGVLKWHQLYGVTRAVYNGYTICQHLGGDYHYEPYDSRHFLENWLGFPSSNEIRYRNITDILMEIDAPIA